MYTLENTTVMKNNKACAYSEQKIDYQKSNKCSSCW